MARRSAAQIYAAARAAGLSAAQAVISTAIALAESGGDDTVLGDTALENGTWGPSDGAWQIRTLRSQTGTGGDRDLTALNGNLGRQAQAMATISRGGTDWSAWTTFTRGTYQQFLSQAQAAAGTVGPATSVPGANATGLPGTGAVQDIANSAVDAAYRLAIKVGAGGLGLALLGIGLFYALRGDRAVRNNRAAQDQVRTTVAGSL
jgi:hypothetical protein